MNPGIPDGLPLLIISNTFASVTFFLLGRLSCLNNPFNPGPTLASVESVLWHTSQF